MRPHSEFITRIRESSETPSPYVRRETRGGVLTQKKIKSRFKCCAGAFFRISKIFVSIEKSATSVNCELMKLSEEKIAPLRPSGAVYHTILFLEEQKDHLLSEARSVLDMQELRVERCRQSSSRIRSTASLSKDGTLTGESKRERRIGYAQNWTEEKEFFKRMVREIFR